MCQLLGLSASNPVRLTFNWETFVVRGSWDGGNPDGWGVAYFNNADAQIFREPVPAAESPMVQFLARHAPLSTTVVSHVRRAVGSALKLANTQPFARTLGGHTHVFAHNGFVSLPWPVHDQPWLKPVGDTDSEALFNRLLEQITPLWSGTAPPELENRLEALRQFTDEIRQYPPVSG
jgi:glutamine amidotransferase